jgi:hypothetical protein
MKKKKSKKEIQELKEKLKINKDLILKKVKK